MQLEYVPLLAIQRELQGVPRGPERFEQYLRTLTTADGKGIKLPSLGIMNPMGREHVTELLDAYIALDADGIAGRTVAETTPELADVPREFKVGLVIADDLKGGWTNRYDYEFNLRFGESWLAGGSKPRWLEHWWLTGVLWSSEPASERAVRETIRTVLHRTAYVSRHGIARTLREKMAQEGEVMARAGCTLPPLDDDDIEYTREMLQPFLDADDKRTTIECMFGDAASRTLGFTPRGLSHWAGLAVALHDVQSNSITHGSRRL